MFKKLDPELATVLVMSFLISAAGLLDWWLAGTFGQQYTMTDFIRRVTFHNVWLQTAITLAFGMLIGHFFLWPSYDPTDEVNGRQPLTLWQRWRAK